MVQRRDSGWSVPLGVVVGAAAGLVIGVLLSLVASAGLLFLGFVSDDGGESVWSTVLGTVVPVALPSSAVLGAVIGGLLVGRRRRTALPVGDDPPDRPDPAV